MSEKRVSVKDDTALFDSLERERERRRAVGVPEPTERQLTDPVTARREYQRMQRARTVPWAYYIVIEYQAGTYHAQALSFPAVTATGETVEAVKENIALALQAHMADLLNKGKPVPMQEYKRVDTVEVCLEDLPAQPEVVTEEIVAV